MKVLLVSATPANRQLLIQFMRSVVEGELSEKLMLESLVYAQVPDGQPTEPYDVVVVDVIENSIVKATMEKIYTWANPPMILGYFVGEQRYVEETMLELGAKACLQVRPSRTAIPMDHVPFFHKHLQALMQAAQPA
jgi:hypothetical protein